MRLAPSARRRDPRRDTRGDHEPPRGPRLQALREAGARLDQPLQCNLNHEPPFCDTLADCARAYHADIPEYRRAVLQLVYNAQTRPSGLEWASRRWACVARCLFSQAAGARGMTMNAARTAFDLIAALVMYTRAMAPVLAHHSARLRRSPHLQARGLCREARTTRTLPATLPTIFAAAGAHVPQLRGGVRELERGGRRRAARVPREHGAPRDAPREAPRYVTRRVRGHCGETHGRLTRVACDRR